MFIDNKIPRYNWEVIISSAQIRQKYLRFFADRGHTVIPSAPLVPENDPTTLFTSSGMQPLVPYLLGQKHPAGKRLVNSQKSFRAQDIEEVGDNRHTTFFEMLGNWSLGDAASPDGIGKAGYFKKEQLPWIFEFLTKELGLDPKRLYITVFEGNKSVPKDTESIKIWKELFKKEGIEGKEGVGGKDKIETARIFTYPAKKNWWSRSGEPKNMPAGEPGGPDSEVFFDFGDNFRTHENSIYKNEQCHPNCDCGRFLEIANSVFMQYQKQADGSLTELPQKNVDFGGGLERLTAAANNQPDIFQTDLFWEAIQLLNNKNYKENPRPYRIIADHLKAAMFIIAAGVEPSNKDRGYVLRRLIRRAALQLHQFKIPWSNAQNVIPVFQKVYSSVYPVNINTGEQVIGAEISKFQAALGRGLKEFNKLKLVDGPAAFNLFQSYGFPWEIIAELIREKTKTANLEKIKSDFESEIAKHQQLSRSTSAGMFKGGLADRSETVTKLHTATHLLHAALRKFLGVRVHQTGSNITADRLRFDFSYPAKLTDADRQKIETWVNEQIKKDLPVSFQSATLEEAKHQNALAFFGERYGAKVNVYTIGNSKTGIVSMEVCGGPHVSRTGLLGRFKLGKEENIGADRQRIYAILES